MKGAHVNLKEQGQEEETVFPAIVPTCGSCNTSGKAVKWKSKALRLNGVHEEEYYYLGKLHSSIEPTKNGTYTGAFWYEVKSVKYEVKNQKGKQIGLTTVIGTTTTGKKKETKAEVGMYEDSSKFIYNLLHNPTMDKKKED